MNWFKKGFPADDEVPARSEPTERAEEVAKMCRDGMSTSGILDGEHAFLESIEKQALEKGWVSEKQVAAVENMLCRMDQRADAEHDRDIAGAYDGGGLRWDRDRD